jgi:hypothetical protein
MKRFASLALCLFVFQATAQFSDSVHNRLRIGATGTFNRTSDGITYLLNNNFLYGVKKQRFVMNANAGWLYGSNPESLTNNDFTSSLDFNIYNKKNPNFYYWGLVNFTSSYSLKIKEQVQSGAGLAYRIINKEGLMINISDGLIYERSNIIQPDKIELSYQTIRNSLRLQCNYKYKDVITLAASGFWQPSLQYANDYIITTNVTTGFKIWRWITLNTTLSYNVVSRTEKENFMLTYGIIFERFF